MSKTLLNWSTPWPCHAFGVDTIRYYLMRAIAFAKTAIST